MSMNSKIEWTTHTFNAWRGCTKVSPGCAHCYADRQAKRNPAVLGIWGDDGTRVIASDTYWGQLSAWDRAAAKAGERHRVFCLSMGDLFEPRVELVEPRKRLMEATQQTPNLDYLFLTKRPEYVADRVPPEWLYVSRGPGWPSNVWLGVSVEDRKHGFPRIEELRQLPPLVRFLSCEPLLEDLGTLDLDGIDWVIVGGESGPHARPMHPAWVRSIRDQCQAASVAFFFKQWGEWAPLSAHPTEGGPLDRVKFWDDETGDWATGIRTFAEHAVHVGKHVAGRMLDGREWSEFPAAPVSA